MAVSVETYKALFFQLTEVCGGVEACAAKLNISHQRVSQLRTLGNDQEPNMRRHIEPLEEFCDQAIVSDYFVRLRTGRRANDPLAEAVQMSAATSRVLTLVHDQAAPKDISKAINELKGEADDCLAAVEGRG